MVRHLIMVVRFVYSTTSSPLVVVVVSHGRRSPATSGLGVIMSVPLWLRWLSLLFDYMHCACHGVVCSPPPLTRSHNGSLASMSLLISDLTLRGRVDGN